MDQSLQTSAPLTPPEEHTPRERSCRHAATWVTTWSVAILAAIGWAVLLWGALDMDHPLAQLTMPDSPEWRGANLLAVAVMWTVMMAAMMLPSALPTLRAFVRLCLRSGERARASLFVSAYLLVWTGFGLLATAVQWAAQARGWISPMVVSTSAGFSAALLLVAGLYQFSPLKAVCLARCRSPTAFLLGEWRPGRRGALVMGLRHGFFCVGCCWVLMGLLFVGGAMNLLWVLALALLVAVEKLAAAGERIASGLGIVLLAAGLLKLAALL